MTYLEIVIQERTTDGRAILTHRHMTLQGPGAGNRAVAITNQLTAALGHHTADFQLSDPLRPCLLCWQLTQEEKHDTPTSRRTKTR